MSCFITFIEFLLVDEYCKRLEKLHQGELNTLSSIEQDIKSKTTEYNQIDTAASTLTDSINKSQTHYSQLTDDIYRLVQELKAHQQKSADFKERSCPKCGNYFDNKKAVAGHLRHCKVELIKED